MAEKAKITKSIFKKEWSGNGSITYYHDVELEGRDGAWNIGAQKKDPDFLAVGQELNFEVTDASKKKIKRVKDESAGFGGFKGSSKTFVDNSVGMMVGSSLGNATLLVAHGKVELKDLEATARRIAEISVKLKAEFKDKV